MIGGNLSVAGSAAVGAAAAIPIVTKETHAFIGDGAHVTAGAASGLSVGTGAFVVKKIDPRFDPSTGGLITGGSVFNLGSDLAGSFHEDERVLYDNGGSPSISGLTSVEDDPASVYYVHIVSPTAIQLKTAAGGTTSGGVLGCGTAVCGLGAPAARGESHRFVPTDQAGVREDLSPRFDPQNGIDVNTATNTITLPYNVGIANDDQVVYSSGDGEAIGGLRSGQTYYATSVGSTAHSTTLQLAATKGGAAIDLTSTGTGKSHSIVEGGNTPSGDASETGPRVITPSTSSLSGVAVTASNSDDLAVVGVSAGISGTAAVNLSGAVAVVTANTSAYIGKSAIVNSGGDVRVAAGNQYHELSVAATLAIGGDAGVGVGVGIHLVTLNTDAYIDNSATVNAANGNVAVVATGQDAVVAVVAGVAAGTVGVAGTVAVTILNVHTFASTGTDVTILAGNNVLVSAADDTKLTLITASLAGGYVGVGVAVGVALLTKDTEAFIGAGSNVDAQANGAAINGIFNGNFTGSGGFATSSFHGLAVQSASSEDIFGLAASAGVGFVGVAGGVGVTLLHVTTQAFVGNGAIANSDNGSVNVAAVDSFKSLTVAGGAAGGFVGVAGGIDIGVADSSVAAYLGAGTSVNAGADVGVFGLSTKDVQTYALSIGAGFVGVGGSVSVWTIGTQPVTTYNDAAGGPDRGAWSGSADYNKGDVVTFSGSKYAAKIDHPTNDPSDTSQWEGSTNALAGNAGGTGQGKADDAASGNDESGGPGYKSILNGASAAPPSGPAWVSGNPYSQGDHVSFGGQVYTARAAVTSATTPDKDGTNWALNSQSDAKTNSRVSDGLNSPKATLSGAAPTGNVASDALTTVVPAGTSASIQGNVVAGHGVHVRAKDNLTVNGIAGSIAVGAVGVGAAILVMNVDSSTDASIAAGSSITAGGSGSGDVSVEASMNEDVSGLAFSGTGGFVAVGAQVVVLNDTGTQNAHVDDGAAIHQAGGGVFVTTTAIRTVDVGSIGVGVGAGAVGAAVAVSDVSGDASATIGNVLLGDGGLVAGLTVTVTDSINAPTKAIAVEGGVGAGLAGAIAFSTLSGTTSASSGAHGTVGVGGVTVSATGSHTAKANTLNVATGALAVGVTVAHVSESRATLATVTSSGNISSGGAVLIAATATNEAEATAPGGAAGGVAIDILVPIAEVSGNTNAQVDGSFTNSTSISVQAHASNHAKASVLVVGVSVVGLTGAFAQATVSGGVSAGVGSGATLGSSGAVLVEAELIGPHQAFAEASATAGSLGVIGSLSLMDTQATVKGNVIANLSGNVTGSTSITVRAQGANTATGTTAVVGIGTYAGAGGGAGAEVDGNTNATSGAGTWTSSGLVLVTATSNNNATASSDIGTGGLIAIAVSLPSATVNGGTRAELAANVDPTAVEVHATSDNDAIATSTVIDIGLLGGGSGTNADATVGTGATTEALVDSSASIDAAGGTIEVLATSDNNATASIPGGGGGLVNVTVMIPTALVEGGTRAHLDGDVVARRHAARPLEDVEHGERDLSRDLDRAALHRRRHPVRRRGHVGRDQRGLGRLERDDRPHRQRDDPGRSDGGKLGDGDRQRRCRRRDRRRRLPDQGDRRRRGAGGGRRLDHLGGTHRQRGGRQHGRPRRRFSVAIAGLLNFSGAGALAEVTSAADVTARTGSTAFAHGPVSVTASSTNTANATSDAASGSFAISLVVNKPTAKVGGATFAQFNGDADNATSVLVQATSANTATATRGHLLDRPDRRHRRRVVRRRGHLGRLDSGARRLDVVHHATGVDVHVFATSANHATATAHGSAGGIGLAIAVMMPSATVGGLTKASFDGGAQRGVAHRPVADVEPGHRERARRRRLDRPRRRGRRRDGDRRLVGRQRGVDRAAREHHRRRRGHRRRGPDGRQLRGRDDRRRRLRHRQRRLHDRRGSCRRRGAGGGRRPRHRRLDRRHCHRHEHRRPRRPRRSGISALSFSGAGTLAEITNQASVTARVGSSAELTTTNAITVSATSHNTATATSDAASGGFVGGFSFNLPKALDNGGTLAELDGTVDWASAVTVQSNATNTATSKANVFSITGLIGVAAANSSAEVGSGASTVANVGFGALLTVPSGTVQVLSTSTNHADATANGFTGGLGVSVAIMNPTAIVGAPTEAGFDGALLLLLFLPTITLVIRSRTSNFAKAHANIDAISLTGAGAAGDGDAEIAGADNTASIGPDANITVSGAVTVDAGQNAANLAQANIDGTTFGFVSGAILAAEAHVGGAVLAESDGSVNSGSLSVQANGANHATATTKSEGLGVGFSFSGSGTLADVNKQADVTAKVGPSAHAQNNISVTAVSANSADATSDAASGGLIGGGSVDKPTARVSGGTLAEFDGDVTNGTSVVISAASGNTATATSKIFSIGGLASVAGATSDAEITADATTAAAVGQASSIDAPGVTIQESATSANKATATASGASGSLGISVVIMHPTAKVGGPTSASYDGDITNAAGLNIQTNTANNADAHTSIVNIGLGAAASGADPDAEITPSAGNAASIGPHAVINVGGAVNVTAAQTAANTATAHADGGGGGLIEAGFFSSDALVAGSVSAEMDGGVTANTLTVSANGANTASATTKSLGIGGLLHFSASGTFARITSDAGTSAQVGSTAVIATTGTTMVTSSSTNQATATSDSAGGSLGLSMTAALPTAKVDGPTYSGFDGTVTQSGDITISSTSANNATATTDAFSIGLLGSLAVGSSDAEVTSGATTRADVGSSANITAPGSNVSVTATGANSATAVSENSGGGLLALSAQLPTAKTAGSVTAEFDGGLNAGSLTVHALGENTPTATASVETISLIGASGAFAEADVTGDAATDAIVGGSAHIATTGGINVHSELHDSKNAAVASALGLSGALFASISVMGSKAEVDAPVRARVDGTVTASGSLTVEADGGNDAGASTDVTGLTIGFAGAGAGAGTVIGSTADTNATVGGNVTTSGLLHVKAIGNNTAHTTSSAATIGFVGIGISLPTASVAGGTLAEFDGTAIGAGSITIEAGSTNTARSRAQVTAFGLFAGAGASSTANVTGDANTDANVGSSALINSPAAVVTVTAQSGNLASAVAGSIAGGVIAVGDANPSATDEGETGASFLGSVHGASTSDSGAAEINVQANGTDASQASVDSGQGGAISVDTSTANATTNSSANGTFGDGNSRIAVSGNIHFGIEDDGEADSSSHGDSGGLVKISSFHSHANMTSHVTLNVGAGAQITAGGSIDINATNNKPPDPISDGTFDANSQVDPGTDSISFTFHHALTTGDIVTYDDRGHPAIGGLDERQQVRRDRAGGPGRPLLDPARLDLLERPRRSGNRHDRLRRARAGRDASRRRATCTTATASSTSRPGGSSSVGGLVSGTLYTVKVIDAETIKLVDPSVTLHSASTVNPDSDISGDDTINVSNDFAAGDNVTYHAPGVDATFSSSAVDVDEVTLPVVAPLARRQRPSDQQQRREQHLLREPARLLERRRGRLQRGRRRAGSASRTARSTT